MSNSGQYQALAATFATAGVEGFLNGIFVVLCLTALYLLIHRSPSRMYRQPKVITSLSIPMVFGSVLLLVLIVAHWACTMIRILTVVSFISRGLSPLEYLHDVSNPLIMVMSLLILFSITTADSLLIWRLWIVSNHKQLIIIPPLCTGFGFFICGLRASIFFGQSKAQYGSIHSPEISVWVSAGALFTICTNIYCSGSLMICIYKIQARTVFGDKKRLKSILVIIVESAAVWSAWSLFVFINYHLESFLSLLSFDGGPAMAGIAFMLINVRVGLGWDTTPKTTSPSETRLSVQVGGGLPTFSVDVSPYSSEGTIADVEKAQSA